MQITRRGQMIRLLAVILLAAALTVGPALAAPLVDDEDPPDATPNAFCVGREIEHPAVGRLAELYEVDYTTLIGWFCDDGFGVGQIMLALTTAAATGDDAADLLTERAEGRGWGEIWQDRGLIGRGRQMDQEDGEVDDADAGGPPVNRGRPVDKGLPPGLDRGEGNGPPGLQNRPQNPGNSRGRGRP